MFIFFIPSAESFLDFMVRHFGAVKQSILFLLVSGRVANFTLMLKSGPLRRNLRLPREHHKRLAAATQHAVWLSAERRAEKRQLLALNVIFREGASLQPLALQKKFM